MMCLTVARWLPVGIAALGLVFAGENLGTAAEPVRVFQATAHLTPATVTSAATYAVYRPVSYRRYGRSSYGRTRSFGFSIRFGSPYGYGYRRYSPRYSRYGYSRYGYSRPGFYSSRYLYRPYGFGLSYRPYGFAYRPSYSSFYYPRYYGFSYSPGYRYGYAGYSGGLYSPYAYSGRYYRPRNVYSGVSPGYYGGFGYCCAPY